MVSTDRCNPALGAAAWFHSIPEKENNIKLVVQVEAAKQ
jgi:hypothetical protein